MQVGLDLIELARIERALQRDGFRARVYTEAEQAYCESRANPLQSYAGRFAAKEAIGKALGCGVHFTWREIEVVGRPKPKVTLTGKDGSVRRPDRRGRDRRVADALARAGGGGGDRAATGVRVSAGPG